MNYDDDDDDENDDDAHDDDVDLSYKFCLKKVVRAAWKKVLTPAYVDSLYRSIPRRMQAVLTADGSHTKYWQFVLFLV